MELSVKRPIVVLSGTNRPGANALNVATYIANIYADLGVPHKIMSLADLPQDVFTPDVYASKPESFSGMQQQILDAAGLHVVTPEYNSSFPGILKYFIDLLKFPESFEHKPVALVGEAAGRWGGMRPVEQLAQIFQYRSGLVHAHRVFLPSISDKIDDAGNVSDDFSAKLLRHQCEAFAEFVRSAPDFNSPPKPS